MPKQRRVSGVTSRSDGLPDTVRRPSRQAPPRHRMTSLLDTSEASPAADGKRPQPDAAQRLTELASVLHEGLVTRGEYAKHGTAIIDAVGPFGVRGVGPESGRVDGVQPPLPWHTLELRQASIVEADAGPGDQVFHGLRDQYFTSRRMR
jgi:hypothetical protein